MRRAIQVLVSIAFAALGATAQAQVDYPSKPVRIICNSAPGSATDVTARIVADGLSKLWNQQVRGAQSSRRRRLDRGPRGRRRGE